MNSIYDKVIELVKMNAPNQNVQVTLETRLFEDLGYDSIATMKLLVDAEEEFGFDSEDSEESLEAYETVETFAIFVEKMIRRNK